MLVEDHLSVGIRGGRDVLRRTRQPRVSHRIKARRVAVDRGKSGIAIDRREGVRDVQAQDARLAMAADVSGQEAVDGSRAIRSQAELISPSSSRQVRGQHFRNRAPKDAAWRAPATEHPRAPVLFGKADKLRRQEGGQGWLGHATGAQKQQAFRRDPCLIGRVRQS